MTRQETIEAVGEYIITKLYDDWHQPFRSAIQLLHIIKECLLSSNILQKNITLEEILDYIKNSDRLISNEFKLHVIGTNHNTLLILRDKTNQEQLQSFYDNWHFYQKYKDKEHYAESFAFKYE